jgi:hypothetical protein
MAVASNVATEHGGSDSMRPPRSSAHGSASISADGRKCEATEQEVVAEMAFSGSAQ